MELSVNSVNPQIAEHGKLSSVLQCLEVLSLDFRPGSPHALASAGASVPL